MVASAQEEEYHGSFAQSGCPFQGISRVTGDAIDGSNLISSISFYGDPSSFPYEGRWTDHRSGLHASPSRRVLQSSVAIECCNRVLESCVGQWVVV
jgi:hypothetical protein